MSSRKRELYSPNTNEVNIFKGLEVILFVLFESSMMS